MNSSPNKNTTLKYSVLSPQAGLLAIKVFYQKFFLKRIHFTFSEIYFTAMLLLQTIKVFSS